MKKLLLGIFICWIGLSICNYFKFEVFGSFMIGSIAYGLYDILCDIKTEKKDI